VPGTDVQVLKNQISTLESQIATLRGALQGVVFTVDPGQTPEANSSSDYHISLNPPSLAIPVDGVGAVLSYAGLKSSVKVMFGPDDKTAEWSFSIVGTDYVTCSLAGAEVTITASDPNISIGWIDIQAVAPGISPRVRRLVVTTVFSPSITLGTTSPPTSTSTANGSRPRTFWTTPSRLRKKPVTPGSGL